MTELAKTKEIDMLRKAFSAVVEVTLTLVNFGASTATGT